MIPDPVNKEVSEYTAEELLYAVPTAFGIRDWVEGLTVCMLDEPVRIGMMYVPNAFPEFFLVIADLIGRKSAQPWYKHLIVWSVLRSSAFIQKWLMLPRSDLNYRFPVNLSLNRNNDGSINPRMHPNKFAVRPWYKPEATTALGKAWHGFLVFTKWHSEIPAPSSVLNYFVDANPVCLPRYRLHSNGYRLEEMGPMTMEKCKQELCRRIIFPRSYEFCVAGNLEVLEAAGQLLGCPITGAFTH
jgi:hypothetical protein